MDQTSSSNFNKTGGAIDWAKMLSTDINEDILSKHKKDIANEIYELRKAKKQLEARVSELEKRAVGTQY